MVLATGIALKLTEWKTPAAHREELKRPIRATRQYRCSALWRASIRHTAESEVSDLPVTASISSDFRSCARMRAFAMNVELLKNEEADFIW